MHCHFINNLILKHDYFIVITGDQLTTILNNLINRIWQISDKESSKKRATITWLWVCCFFVVVVSLVVAEFLTS